MNIEGKNIFIHKTCNSLSIYAYCMIALHGDFRFLIKGYKPDKGKQYSDLKSDPKLKAIFDNIVKEHNIYIADKSSLDKEKAMFELKELNLRYSITVQTLTLYKDTKSIEVLDLLNELGFSFNEFKPVGPQIDKVQEKLKGMRNLLNIKEIAFKKKYVKEDVDENRNINVIEGLDSKALSLETNLGLGYKINIKKTSVIRWENLISKEELKLKSHG